MAGGLKGAYKNFARKDSINPKRLILLTNGETTDEKYCIEEAENLSKIGVLVLSIGTCHSQGLLISISEITKGKHVTLN